MAITDKLKAIADAIREKTGKANVMTLEQMPTEIEAIVGGGSDYSNEDGLVSGSITIYRNDRITQVRAYSFYQNVVLEEVNLPNVANVGAYAFYGNSLLKSISMPNVTNIETYGLQKCTSLESVSFLKLSKIGDRAIQDCTKLKSIDLPLLANVSRNICYGCSKLESVNLPSATKLGYYTFTNCVSLTALDFPLVTYIENSSFEGCSQLVTLILRSTTRCQLNGISALNSTPIANGTGYIYVPSALVESYKTATNWSNFASQIRAIEDYPEITGG